MGTVCVCPLHFFFFQMENRKLTTKTSMEYFYYNTLAASVALDVAPILYAVQGHTAGYRKTWRNTTWSNSTPSPVKTMQFHNQNMTECSSLYTHGYSHQILYGCVKYFQRNQLYCQQECCVFETGPKTVSLILELCCGEGR